MKDLKNTRLHFVGIGGIGMSGIAEVFFNQGYEVSGSDVAESDSTRRLGSLGLKVAIGHDAKNVDGASVVVISSAIRPTNPEVVEARRLRIPVIQRAEMLGELMRGKIGIALAGTHGKTTTTSMAATLLSEVGLDPTLVIGGKVDALGGNAKLGRGAYVVAEADESDGSFLHLPATYAVVTNIDNDHLDHFGTMEAMEETFVRFLSSLPFYGLSALCGDDPGVKRILPKLTKPYVTYGFSPENDYSIKTIEENGLQTIFDVWSKANGKLGRVTIEVPGRHNALNALAVVCIGLRLGISFSVIAHALSRYQGVKRRFETRFFDLKRNIRIIDDYGHHPTEIAATLQAARQYWKGRIVAVFQPHRYSRTQNCMDGFAGAFGRADRVWMTDIYPAGEDPIEGVNAQGLVQRVASSAEKPSAVDYVGDLPAAKQAVLADLKDGDLILCMGAGSITRLPDQLIEALR